MSSLGAGGSGYRCSRPIDRDTPRGRFRVGCYKCANCLKGRRQDLVGRITAQATTSKYVWFVCLTYGGLYPFPDDGRPWVQLPIPEDDNGAFQFRKIDWDRAIDRLRKDVGRAFGTSVKFFFAFEKGERKERVHIHAIIMFDGEHGMTIDPDSSGRVWMHWWRWGHLNISEIKGTAASVAASVRYCAKYALKTYGGIKAPCGWSKAGLASEFLIELAQRHVEQGLVPQNWFQLPGVTFSAGKHKGQHQKFFLRGSGARVYAEAYRQAFESRFPDRTAYAQPWMLAADDRSIDPVLTDRVLIRDTGWHPHSPLWSPRDCTASRTVSVNGRFVGLLRLDADGLANYQPQVGPPIYLGDHVGQLPDIDPVQLGWLQDWVDQQRGVGWRPPDVRQAERDAVVRALASRDIGTRLGDVIARPALGSAAVLTGDPVDPLGLPKGVGGDLRRRILAAKLRDP